MMTTIPEGHIEELFANGDAAVFQVEDIWSAWHRAGIDARHNPHVVLKYGFGIWLEFSNTGPEVDSRLIAYGLGEGWIGNRRRADIIVGRQHAPITVSFGQIKQLQDAGMQYVRIRPIDSVVRTEGVRIE